MKVSEGFFMADSCNIPKVDLTMLLEYMSENSAFNVAEIRGAKVMLSSRDAYVDTSVGFVEVKRDCNICHIKGRVTPEHKVRSKMYTVIAKIDEVKETILELVCEDCAASQGGCKHSICFIAWLIKRTEEPSVTSVKCYWTQPKLAAAIANNKFILAQEMGKQTNRTQPAIRLTHSLTRPFFLEECRKRNMKNSLLSNYNFNTASLDNYRIYKLVLDFTSTISKEDILNFNKYKEFAEKTVTDKIKNDIEEKTRHQADSQLWHLLRQGRVTASKIFETSRCNTEGVLVKSILGGYKIPETNAIKRGKLLEKEVLKEIEKIMNIKIKKCGFKLINSFIGASPDGLCEEQQFTLEIKCPINSKNIENYIKNHVISQKCKAQIQLQMCAMKTKKALFCIADADFEKNKKIYQHWVYYDSLFVEKLINEAEIFWEKFIFRKMVEIVNA